MSLFIQFLFLESCSYCSGKLIFLTVMVILAFGMYYNFLNTFLIHLRFFFFFVKIKCRKNNWLYKNNNNYQFSY